MGHSASSSSAAAPSTNRADGVSVQRGGGGDANGVSTGPGAYSEKQRAATLARIGELREQVRRERKPINLVVSGPPGVDTGVLCHYLARECNFLYCAPECDGEPGRSVTGSAARAAAAAALALEARSQAPSRHVEERNRTRQCMMQEIETNYEVIAEIGSAIYTQQQQRHEATMAQHALRIINHQLRHLVTVPTADSMLTADTSDWARPLWRVFRDCVASEYYGYVCSSAACGLISETGRRLLERLSVVAFDVMLKDCSPSNTLVLYVMPDDQSYADIVKLSLDDCTDDAERDASARLMWETRSRLDATYLQSAFTERYFSLVLSTSSPMLDGHSMEVITLEALEYVCDLSKRGVWCGMDRVRVPFLRNAHTQSNRLRQVPRSPAATLPSTSSQGFVRPPINMNAFLLPLDDDAASSSSSSSSSTLSATGDSTASSVYRDHYQQQQQQHKQKQKQIPSQHSQKLAASLAAASQQQQPPQSLPAVRRRGASVIGADAQQHQQRPSLQRHYSDTAVGESGNGVPMDKAVRRLRSSVDVRKHNQRAEQLAAQQQQQQQSDASRPVAGGSSLGFTMTYDHH